MRPHDVGHLCCPGINIAELALIQWGGGNLGLTMLRVRAVNACGHATHRTGNDAFGECLYQYTGHRIA